MKYVEIVVDAGRADTMRAVADKVKAEDFRVGLTGEDGMQEMRLLVRDGALQQTLDLLQTLIGAQPAARIVVLTVEAHLPKSGDESQRRREDDARSRESLYEEVRRGTRLDSTFLLLVFLSTVVAAIGLIEDNLAVVIGAMVIAPLLGPNLALSLGTALGDMTLVRSAVASLSLGILLAVGLSLTFGLVWPGDLRSAELMARTHAGLDSIALALASGAAATLSLTSGVSAVLVGVMVAVALLPPAVTLGLMLGQLEWELALGAGLLLAINIVSVNLASKIVFLAKGIRPRTWLEKEQARQAMLFYLAGWAASLLALAGLIFLRGA